MKRTAHMAAVLAISMMLIACGEQASPQGADASPLGDAGALPEPLEQDGAGSLHQRAAQALAEQRMVSPAGRNAVEYFLAARAEDAGDGRAQAALLELQPYLLIAVEQALARGDAPEAARLLSLVSRIDAHAPALPRLNEALTVLQRESVETAQRKAGVETASARVDTPPASPAVAAPPSDVSAATSASPAVPTPTQGTPMSAAQAEASRVDAVLAAVAADTPPARAPETAAITPRAAAPRAPRLLQDVPPRYPLPALRAGMEGQAEVAFTIQPDGSVRNVQLVSSTPPGVFDASAVAVAQRWRFEATGQVHALRRTVLFRLPAGERSGG